LETNRRGRGREREREGGREGGREEERGGEEEGQGKREAGREGEERRERAPSPTEKSVAMQRLHCIARAAIRTKSKHGRVASHT
jgi:hypothetical protein